MVSSHLKNGSAKYSSKDELHLVDGVLAALCFQSEGRALSKSLNIQIVYRAFADLREAYPIWLQDLRFTYGPADTVPISGVLEDILFDLGASGIMEVANPWYKSLKIPTSKLKIIKRAIAQRRSDAEQEELKNLANEFFNRYKKLAEKK